MRTTLFVLAVVVLAACTSQKSETTESQDSTAADSTIATSPAPASLASLDVEGWLIDNNLATPDSVNYFLLANMDEMNNKFKKDDRPGVMVVTPDFTLNFVIAAVCQPTKRLTTITLEKVVTGDQAIHVYLNISRGEEQKTSTKSSGVFLFERRDGYASLEFYINGKPDKSLMLLTE